jgi:hypothetical protein
MKKTLLLIFCLQFFQYAYSQKQAWKWYFGSNAAMDFSSGVPEVLYNSVMYQYEGSSSIADENGELLFYTDGLTVWNKEHEVMQNGSGLLGDASSTQSSLVVPKPYSDSIYYLFTTSGYWAHYSEIDITLDGGLGAVTGNKNILISNNSAEKLAGVHAYNDVDFWVAIHQNNNNTFLAYYVDSNGVNTTPVVSIVGNQLIGNIGQLQFSPNGKRAAMASYSSPNSETVDVFDFNDTTGVLSSHIGLPTPGYFQTYGLEFSPNSQLLYSGANPGYNQVHQWNLAAGDVNDIIASDVVVGTTLGDCGSLQLGPDGKIYVAQYVSYYVGVINFPDSVGTACDWNEYAVNLSPGQCQLGLPNFVVNIAFSPPGATAFGSATPEICQKFCLDFLDSSLNSPVSWEWIFEGGSPSSSSDQNPTGICYSVAGNYDVTLITTTAAGLSDTLTQTNYVTVFETPPFPTITQTDYTLTSSEAVSYQWQFNAVDIPGATEQTYQVLQTGVYTVVITDENGCKNSTSLYVLIVGVEEISTDFSFLLTPNPGDGLIQVTWKGNAGEEKIQFRITNSLGQILFSSNEPWPPQVSKSFDLRYLPAGVYHAEFRAGDQYLVQKFNLIHH